MGKLPLEKWASLVILLFGAGVGVLLGARYVLPAVLPFLLAWGFAFLLRPLSSALAKKFRIKQKAASVLVTLFVLGTVFLVLYFLVRQMLIEGEALLVWLKNNPAKIEGFFVKLNSFLSRFRPLFPHLGEGSNMVEELFYFGIETVVGKLPNMLGAVFTKLPGILLFFGVTLIAAVYFSLDLEKINAAVLGLLPDRWAKALRKVKEGALKTVLAYLRAYLLLMTLTFALLLFGFIVFRIPYALLLAFISALVDFLPVLGVGAVLVPWGLFCLLFGQTGRGAALLSLYVIAVTMRQVAEPKIVGERLGIPPLLTLVYLYAGLRLFGFWGIFIGPFLGVVLRGAFGLLLSKPKQDLSPTS